MIVMAFVNDVRTNAITIMKNRADVGDPDPQRSGRRFGVRCACRCMIVMAFVNDLRMNAIRIMKIGAASAGSVRDGEPFGRGVPALDLWHGIWRGTGDRTACDLNWTSPDLASA
jgi:hypothetical protein